MVIRTHRILCWAICVGMVAMSTTNAQNTTAPKTTSTQSPTGSPISTATQSPVATATTANPSQSPTLSKTTQSPTTPRFTSFPTGSPVVVATGTPVAQSDAPSMAPSSKPTTFVNTNAPTILPTGNPSTSPTNAPIIPPTAKPQNKPTRKPTRKPRTESPTSNPTFEGTPITETVGGITVTFNNVGELSKQEISEFASITTKWFDESFNTNTNSQRSRLLLGKFAELEIMNDRLLQGISSDVRNMNSTIEVTGQSFTTTSNTLKYNQTLRYNAVSDAPNATDLALLPFKRPITNSYLVQDLQENIGAFSQLDGPISVPTITESQDDNLDNEKFPMWAIIAIAVGGSLAVCLVFYVGMRSMNSKDDDGNGYHDPSLPPSQFNINAAEDISMIDDPTVAKVGSNDNMSLGNYGDQSVATVDYDYSKAYGGGGDTSVVSSVGGTLGDTTRQTAGDVAANSARAALGAANFDSGDGEFKEQIIVINAPAGKLGVVIDTPDDGAPVVHAVKDSSVIADRIQVGDKLIAVDDDDVRSMTAIKVSKLISKKSANPNRKLTVVRTIHVDQ